MGTGCRTRDRIRIRVYGSWGRLAHRLEAGPQPADVVRWIFTHRLAGHSVAIGTSRLPRAEMRRKAAGQGCSLRSGSAESKLQESLSARLAVHDAEAGGLGEDERGGAQIGQRAVRVTVARRLGSASLNFRLASAVTAQTVRVPVSAGQAVICGSWMESAWSRRQARLPVRSQPHQRHPARSGRTRLVRWRSGLFNLYSK